MSADDTAFLYAKLSKGAEMKRNLFWMVWGVTSLICLMIAGFKSFAMEIESKNQNNQPTYVTAAELESRH